MDFGVKYRWLTNQEWFICLFLIDGSHDDGSPSSPGTAPSPTSSPAMNHQGSGTNTTPSSTGTGAPATTPNDADERQKRTHRSSTDESHAPKTPAQVAPVKPAPIKAPTKPVLTTPIKSTTAAGLNDAASNPRHPFFKSLALPQYLIRHRTTARRVQDRPCLIIFRHLLLLK